MSNKNGSGMAKKITDKEVAKLFHMGERNLQQTYKNPKPTKQKPTISDKELLEKKEQYEILRLGATCKAHNLNEKLLLSAIDFIKNIKDMQYIALNP